jgi:acyl-CoA synthetase (NDP forming)
MAPAAASLERLLRPRHVAFVGGADAAFSAAQCARLFDGPVWGVNPKRRDFDGVPCFPSVSDLPEAPDAVFLAVPRAAALAVVGELAEIGAGGVACFTAGFGELGAAGKAAEAELVAAAGDMALVGPNCYGLINYTNGAALWPFGAGSERCAEGVALVMQSGMLPANLTMNERSLPISYVISAGNQAMLTIEDYIAQLVDDPAVTAFGVYIEGIRSVEKFARAALAALRNNKPVVVLKAGKSALASSLAVSHTGSLAGTDDAFQALFDETGVIRVESPVELVETLKLLSVSGAPRGRRLAAFTCSGGDAVMLADYAQSLGLELAQPSPAAKQKLESLLPDIATVTNPLDYTTPLWGNTETMPKVFEALIEDGYDAAVVVQDFPPAHIHDDPGLYRNDARSFITASNRVGVPGAVCSDLPENIDRESRAMMLAGGVTPLQGLDAGLDALANACRYGESRPALLENARAFSPLPVPAVDCNRRVLDEWQGKQRLRQQGIAVPDGLCLRRADFPLGDLPLGFPLAVKLVSAELPHKSDAGAVRLGIGDLDALNGAVEAIEAAVRQRAPGVECEAFLLESMVEDVIAELMVGITCDAQFGPLLVIASGGVLVEVVRDARTLLLPTSPERIREALELLKSFPLLQGFRGRQAADIDSVVRSIAQIADFACARSGSLVEMDINPLMIRADGAVAADVMIVEAAG